MPFKIPEEEWAFVKTFFADYRNRKVPKLPRSRYNQPIEYSANGKTTMLSHSYYQNDQGDIFAVGNRQDTFPSMRTNRIEGSQGAVKRAENSEGKPYIVKIYDTGQMCPEDIGSMIQEQRLGKKLRIHPTSPTPLIHSVISRKDKPKPKQVAVLEFLGKDLGTWQYDSHPTELQILGVAIQMNALVTALHKGRLALDGVPRIHRDLKRENFTILDGRVHLIDYGLTIDASKGEIGEIAEDSGICGTPKYCAPEVLDSATYSFKSDIYAMGVNLVHLLAREKPALVGRGEWLSPERFNHHCRAVVDDSIATIENPDLRQLIALMINKNPLHRPPLHWVNLVLTLISEYDNDKNDEVLANINLSIATAKLLMREDIAPLLRTQIDRLLSIVNDAADLRLVERAIQKLLPDPENTTSNDYRADAVRCLLWKSMPHEVLTVTNLSRILEGSAAYAKLLAASYRFLKSHEQVNMQDWVAGHGVRATHVYVKNILSMNVKQHAQETDLYLEGKGVYSLAGFWGSSNNDPTSRRALFKKVGFFKDNDETLARSKTLETHTSILPVPMPFLLQF